jgi:heme oxygenase
MRARLKAATAQAHERMHGHAGLAAAAAGEISLADYRDLLARLLGFHAAFDVAMRAAPPALAAAIDLRERARAPALMLDLAALGAPPALIARLPRCEHLPVLAGEGAYLGALYVTEGSTLGGAFIAKALASAVGGARNFFLGHGADHSRLWRNLVQALDRLDGRPAEADAAEQAALATFAAYDRWMADWRGATARLGEPALA